ncbi:helix-turn-helix domain-containing protein [Bacillus sp. Hm123]|uniref:helix-turn-helix domain-containing protein n=1 Tax=Bacillus sp. Hm123 TaxID=3450745 RepID=UPI003F43EB57
MTEKEEYLLKRRRKNIRLVQLASVLGCSHALISMYENNKSNMSQERINKYKNYIDNK